MKMEGAAMASALLCKAQDLPIDKMTYYDARPCGFCGLFKAYTYEKYKTCYAFTLFNKVYGERQRIKADCDDGDIYVLAAKGEKCAGIITYYTFDEAAEKKQLTLDIGAPAKLYLLDKEHDAEYLGEYPASCEVALEPNSVLYFETEE
jgi:hypothetical protein